MRKFIVLWLLSTALWAQQNGNLPTLVQGEGDGQQGVAGASHLVVGFTDWESNSVCPQSATFSDSSGTLSSITFKTSNCINNGTGNGFDPTLVLTPWFGVSASSGTLVIPNSSQAPFPRLAYHALEEFTQGNNLTFDGQNNTGSVGGNNLSVSITTTKNNDLMTACTDYGNSPFSQYTIVPVPTAQQYSSATPQSFSDLGSTCTWWRGGLAGTQTSSWIGGNGSLGLGAVVMAFSCTNVTVGASLMPDGGVGTPYYAKLKACGGSGTYTWSISAGSLQTGLSLNSSTGEITGTPTVSSLNNSVTFRVTESGGGTHADLALPINIGTSLQTVFTRSHCNFAGVSVPPCGTVAQQGDSVYVIYFGDDTHVAMGYTIPTANLVNQCGQTAYRAEATTGEWRGGMVVYSFPPMSCPGPFSATYNGGIGDPLAGVTFACVGCQPIMDDMVATINSPGNVTSANLTPSITTQVPNMFILSASALICTGGCAGSTATNSPFTSIDVANGNSSTATYLALFGENAPTTGSYAATQTFTVPSSMSSTPIMSLLIPIRPAIVSGTLPLGEKIRRYVN